MRPSQIKIFSENNLNVDQIIIIIFFLLIG